jgi:hypothetical protein
MKIPAEVSEKLKQHKSYLFFRSVGISRGFSVKFRVIFQAMAGKSVTYRIRALLPHKRNFRPGTQKCREGCSITGGITFPRHARLHHMAGIFPGFPLNLTN